MLITGDSTPPQSATTDSTHLGECIVSYIHVLVEGNIPHDLSQCFTGIDDLDEVLTMLEPVNERWKELGLALGLKDATLRQINAENPGNIRECKLQMLRSWLQWRDDCKATCNWSSLTEALRKPTVNHKPIAEAIQERFSELMSAN